MPKQSSLKRYAHRTVFVTGSEAARFLSSDFYDALDKIQELDIRILMRDSTKGTEALTSMSLLSLYGYEKVTLFTIHESTESIPAEEWKIQKVQVPENASDQERHLALTRAIAKKADWGLISFLPAWKNEKQELVLDEMSLRSAIQMLLAGKQIKFCFSINRQDQVRVLKSLSDLKNLINLYARETSWNGLVPQYAPGDLYNRLEEKLNKLIESEQKIRLKNQARQPV